MTAVGAGETIGAYRFTLTEEYLPMTTQTLQITSEDDLGAEQLAYCERLIAEWEPVLPDEPQDLSKLTYQPYPLIEYVVTERKVAKSNGGFQPINRAPQDLHGVDDELNKTLDLPEVDEGGRLIPQRPEHELSYAHVDETLDNSPCVETVGELPQLDAAALMRAMSFFATYVTTD